MSTPPLRHLYLAGFMGTGKTTVGRALAERLARRFVDLDMMVQAIRRLTIPEIFRLEGEPAFRLYEAKALRLLMASSGMVIALGGGTPTIPQAKAIMRHCGRTILLTADTETIWRRVRLDENKRPLLNAILSDATGIDETAEMTRFVERAEQLLQRRWEHYRAVADVIVDTSGKPVRQVVDESACWCDAWSRS